MSTIQAISDMLDRNSIPEPNSGCWIWMRGVSGGGYPVWTWNGRRRQVTHLALKLKGIKVPKGFDACHRCDNTFCVNPDHVFVGTRTVNMRDAQSKGRLVGYGKREFCKQGHPLSGDNVRTDPKSGKRSCQICRRRWEKEHYLRSPKRRNRWRHQSPRSAKVFMIS
jgi:hypothetical protein